MSQSVVESIVAGAAFAGVAAGCWRVGVALRRGRSRPYPPAFAWLTLAGLVSMEIGLLQTTLAGGAGSPLSRDIQMTCKIEPPAAAAEPVTIRFDYDSARHCQNVTFYGEVDGRLERVVLKDVKRRHDHSYLARRLTFAPDAANPGRAIFTKTEFTLAETDFSSLMATRAANPIDCPAKGDGAALETARARAIQLETQLDSITPVHKTVTRWDCLADH